MVELRPWWIGLEACERKVRRVLVFEWCPLLEDLGEKYLFFFFLNGVEVTNGNLPTRL